jgi:hypothetical protein
MRRARRRRLCACQAAAQVCRRHWCQPPPATFDHPFAAGPIRLRRPSRSPTTATCRTRCANRGLSHRTDVRNPARCGQRGCGHQTPVCPDTRITPVAWTPVPWTLDVRPSGWTDVRMADSGCGLGDERRGWRPDILDGHDDGDRRLGGANLAWVAASAVLSSPRRLCGDDTPAATVPGQLCSTVRHRAAPRRTALVCWMWRVRGGWRPGSGGKVGRA